MQTIIILTDYFSDYSFFWTFYVQKQVTSKFILDLDLSLHSNYILCKLWGFFDMYSLLFFKMNASINNLLSEL